MLPVAWLAVHEDSMVALPVAAPVQTISAETLFAFLSSRVIWQLPLSFGSGAPNLSIRAWVRQTSTEWGPIVVGCSAVLAPGAAMDVVEVMVHNPGLRLCAEANAASANRQQLNVVQNLVLRMFPPVGCCPSTAAVFHSKRKKARENTS